MALRVWSRFATRSALALMLSGAIWSAHAHAQGLARSAASKVDSRTVSKDAHAEGAKDAKTAKAPDTGARQRAEHLGLGTRAVAGQLLAGRAEPAWIRAAGSSNRLPGTLKVPVAKGWFVRGFGSGKGGYHQAIDIGGEVGWNVRAASGGIVAYAGSDVSGYGNLVILVHPGGFITIYGHNAENRVVAGQRVDRGHVIAELGSTGRSKGPHVHFELLFKGQNCDPGPLLRPGISRKNGKAVGFHKESWRLPDKRPRRIRCHARKHHPDYRNKVEAEAVDLEPEALDDDNQATQELLR